MKNLKRVLSLVLFFVMILGVVPATAFAIAAPTVTGVTLTPAAAEVEKGDTQQFTATVTGDAGVSQTVAWSVSGGTASTINANGLLTVGAAETAEELTVTVRSAADGTKTATATVTIKTSAPTTYAVTVENGTGSGSYTEGETVTITATTVSGKLFKEWTSADGVIFADKKAAATTFTMPAKDVTVTATYNTVIDVVDISNVTKPVAGEMPTHTFTISTPNVDYGSEIFWSRYDHVSNTLDHAYEDSEFVSSVAFRAGYFVALQAEVWAEEGYTFTPDTKIRYNGMELPVFDPANPILSGMYVPTSVTHRMAAKLVWSVEQTPVSQTATIRFTKTDAEGTPLAGAVFHLTEEGTSEPAYAATSDDSGVVSFDVVSGTYILTEYTAPTGYVKTQDTYKFKVDAAAANGRPVELYAEDLAAYTGYEGTLIIENEAETTTPPAPQTATIVVKKTDAEGAPLAGAEFVLENADNEYFATSDANGLVTFEDVVEGYYTLSELEAPDGYIKSEDTYNFNVNATGAVLFFDGTPGSNGFPYDNSQPLTIENEAETTTPPAPQTATIVVKKTDAEGAPLAGAEFVLENADNEYFATSDANGLVTFEDVVEGYYTLSELEAPDGYIKSEDTYNFNVNATGAVLFFDGTPGSNGFPYDNSQPLTIENEAEAVPGDITIEIPVTKAVAKGGTADFSGSQTFEFEVAFNNSNVDVTKLTITGNSVTVTSNAGGSTTIKITVPADLYDDAWSEGIRITEKSGSATGWTYSSESYLVQLSDTGLIFLKETGDTYADAEKIVFTNTYTAAQPTQPTQPTQPGSGSTDNPKTGDGFSMLLWTALLLMSAAALVGLEICRKRCAR